MSTVTDEQAFAAMYRFLEQFYDRSGGSVDVGGLLGSISLLPDGKPADAATAKDWQEAIQFALNGGKAGALILTAMKKPT